MDRDDLFARFPSLRPINHLPSLTMINGCGFALYGRRDYDPQTETYIKTLFFCLLFVPLMPIAAYRVAHSPRGFYFIGREPMSFGVKLLPLILVAAVAIALAAGGSMLYLNSASYKAGQMMKAGDAATAAGHVTDAAEAYRKAATTDADRFNDAGLKLRQLLAGPVPNATLPDAAGAFAVAADMARRRPGLLSDEEVLKQAIDMSRQGGGSDPVGALAVLDAVKPLVPVGSTTYADARLPILQAVVKLKPTDVPLANELALVYESRKDDAAAEAVLTPIAKNLGTTEGARILGQVRARKDDYNGAYELLLPYTTGRLDKLHDAEAAFNDTYDRAGQRHFNELNAHPPDAFRRKYEQANTKEEKAALVNEYISDQLKNDSSITAARDALRETSPIVPVALDLGIVMLRRAQGLPDPAERRKELEAAEKVFLSIRGAAGQTDQYRMFLGQVYYWLGKHDEGRKLLDEFLTSKNREPGALLLVARVHRELGSYGDARTLSEEAYNATSDARLRQDAASFRTLCAQNLDDQIVWLTRCDQSQSSVKASLSETRGHQAMERGRIDDAAQFYREAVDLFLSDPESSASLNNAGLSSIYLYYATGDRAALDKGIALIEQAITLEPTSSIILINATSFLSAAATTAVIGKSIDLPVLGGAANTDMLNYLADDATGSNRLAARFRAEPAAVKAASYVERALVLAPKNISLWHRVMHLYGSMHDDAAMNSIRDRLRGATFDQREALADRAEAVSGKNDARDREAAAAAVKRYEAALAAARAKKDARTAAVAAGELVEVRLSQSFLGEPVNLDDLVTIAERAYAESPSAGTRRMLVSALLHRASQSLAKADPQYSRFHDESRRTLGVVFVIPLAMDRWPSVRDAAVRNADLVRVCDLSLEEERKYPGESTSWTWAMVRYLKPAEADAIGRVVLANQRTRTRLEADLILSPQAMPIAVEAAWLALIEGKTQEARHILKRCADAGGVPRL